MNENIEARKLSIIEYLAELEDESVIRQIENLLKPQVDIWDELSANQKIIIQKGIQDLDNGKRVPFSEFIDKYRQARS